MNKSNLIKKYGDEEVFVVPHEKLSDIQDGFTAIEHDSHIWNKYDIYGHFMLRSDAEGEPSVQQLIPYIVILSNDNNKVFVTERIAGDERLINTLSVGCGGHINRCDGQHGVLFNAAVRELYEELDVFPSSPFKIIGYIRDMKSKTNDHTGIVITLKVLNDQVSIKETDNMGGKWYTIEDLIYAYEKFEGWAKCIIDYLTSIRKI